MHRYQLVVAHGFEPVKFSRAEDLRSLCPLARRPEVVLRNDVPLSLRRQLRRGIKHESQRQCMKGQLPPLVFAHPSDPMARDAVDPDSPDSPIELPCHAALSDQPQRFPRLLRSNRPTRHLRSIPGETNVEIGLFAPGAACSCPRAPVRPCQAETQESDRCSPQSLPRET